MPPPVPSDPNDCPPVSTLDPVGQNIESILAFYAREEQKISGSQRIVEKIGDVIGRLVFLGFILVLVAVWVLYNVLAPQLGWLEWDPAPFSWLQGALSLSALLITIVVLIKQNRLAKLEEQRAHLDLQVNLLTEQKTTKLIQLLEELRVDLPIVKNRDDPEVDALKQPTNPNEVLAAMGKLCDTD